MYQDRAVPGPGGERVAVSCLGGGEEECVLCVGVLVAVTHGCQDQQLSSAYGW